MFKNTLRLARPLAGQTTTTPTLRIRSIAAHQSAIISRTSLACSQTLTRPFCSESPFLNELRNTQDALSHEILELNKKLAYLDGKASVPCNSTNPSLSVLVKEISMLNTKFEDRDCAHCAHLNTINNSLDSSFGAIFAMGVIGVLVVTFWGWVLKYKLRIEVEDVVGKAKTELHNELRSGITELKSAGCRELSADSLRIIIAKAMKGIN